MAATECSCATNPNARIVAERGRCVIVCGTEVDKHWMLCRPCSKGNHTGKPCQRYVREPHSHIVKTCAECGFDSALHPEAYA